MEEKESDANYFDKIQELVNAMRAYKEKGQFDYVAVAIEESKDLDTMELNTNQDQGFGETSESFKGRKKNQAQKQDNNPNKGKEWKFDKRKMRCQNYQKLGHYARECWVGEGAKNKPNNRAHLAQGEGTYSDFKAMSLQLRDQELFQDSAINSEGELIHSTLITKGKLELVDPPSNKKSIALKWVYKVKINLKGEVVKHKARLVAKKAGIYYGEVYVPVDRFETVRLVVAIATNLGFVVKGKENKVRKLKKALYGLKQAPKA
ncbi:hypothetical protein CR513_16982, partial [Mucuna pruriens]